MNIRPDCEECNNEATTAIVPCESQSYWTWKDGKFRFDDADAHSDDWSIATYLCDKCADEGKTGGVR